MKHTVDINNCGRIKERTYSEKQSVQCDDIKSSNINNI
jgi:hypothetical protein